jgi:hypothetical protein
MSQLKSQQTLLNAMYKTVVTNASERRLATSAVAFIDDTDNKSTSLPAMDNLSSHMPESFAQRTQAAMATIQRNHSVRSAERSVRRR